MSRIVGILDIHEKQEIRAPVPGLLEVEKACCQMAVDSERVEKLLINIANRLELLKEAATRGFCERERITVAAEWLDVYWDAWRRYRVCWIDSEFVDGSGI